MNKALFLSSLLLLSADVVQAQSSASVSSTSAIRLPQISIVAPTFDFGTVMQGTKVEHSFELKNSGQAPLDIQSLQPGCGCTAAVPDKRTLQPGESAQIRATFDTTNFQGYKVKTVRVNTNDPKNPSAVIGFQGTVQLDISVDPSRVYFGRVKKSSRESREVSITVGPKSNAQVVEATPRADFIDVALQPLADGKGSKLVVKLKNDIPTGVLRGRIVVKTTSANNPVLSVPVFAMVEGDLNLEPVEVSFGLLESPLKFAPSQSIRIRNSSERPIHVLNAESSDKNVIPTLKTIDNGKEYSLSVALKPETLGPVKAQVKLTTDHSDPAQRELQIPVYGIVARKGS